MTSSRLGEISILDPVRTRRQLLRSGVFGAGLLATSSWLSACGSPET